MTEWGPWIEHGGKGCPCVGQYVRVQFDDSIIVEGIAGSCADEASAGGFDPLVGWKWAVVPTANAFFVCARVVRYRIRKSRALQQLKDLIENLPEEAPANSQTATAVSSHLTTAFQSSRQLPSVSGPGAFHS